MERGGQAMSEAAIYVTFSVFFILFYFFVVLKIAAGLLLNKTSAGLFIWEFIDLDIESVLGISLSASAVALCNLKGIKVLDSATLEAGKEH